MGILGGAVVGGVAMRPLYATEAPLDVVVVGAGLSGLHAAMLLEESGLQVQVIEGRRRVGGRVYTLMDVPGSVEAGGELIGSTYARMITTARKLNLPLEPPHLLAPPAGWAYHLGGKLITPDEWPSSPSNPLSGDDRKIQPPALLRTLMHRDSPLQGKSYDAWLTPELARYDIPTTDYLRAKGHDEDTLRLAGIVVHTDRLANTSALHEMRRYHVGEASAGNLSSGNFAALQVKGGNSRLPEAMAASLKRGVQLGKAVIAITSDASGVVVHCADNTRTRARFAVVSMPLPRLRDVLFDPGLPEPLASAVQEVNYGLSIQVHMRFREPYWEKDGLPPAMWTDTGIERFTPLARGEGGRMSSVIAFVNGAEARRFAFMNDQQCFEYVAAVAAEIRPSTRGQLELLTIQSCARDPFGAGDWVFWQPGQIVKYGKHMRDGLDRVTFCGEHTAIMQRGMEAAFESGERAAIDVLGRV